eukprot:1196163-Prorocentrum_minimum.AAC.4
MLPLWTPCAPPVDPLRTPCAPPAHPLRTLCGPPPTDPLPTPPTGDIAVSHRARSPRPRRPPGALRPGPKSAGLGLRGPPYGRLDGGGAPLLGVRGHPTGAWANQARGGEHIPTARTNRAKGGRICPQCEPIARREGAYARRVDQSFAGEQDPGARYGHMGSGKNWRENRIFE